MCVCVCVVLLTGFSYLRGKEVGDGRGPAQEGRREVRAVPAVEEGLRPRGLRGSEPAEQQGRAEDGGREHGRVRAGPPTSAASPCPLLEERPGRSYEQPQGAAALLTQA